MTTRWVDGIIAEAEQSGSMVRYQFKETPFGRFPTAIEIATPAEELRAKVKETRKWSYEEET